MSQSWASGSTRAWRRTREYVFARDISEGWRCRIHDQGWCARANAHPHTCTGRREVAHHTRGKKYGDDPTHIVSGCAACNLAIGDPDNRPTTPRARPRTRWTKAPPAPAASKPGNTRVILITGPPAAGKTYYVAQHKQPGDLVLDQDDLGPAQMRRRLAQIHQHDGTAWVIRCCPGPAARAALARQLGAQLIHLCPDTSTLMARAQARPHPRRTVAAIRKWMAREAGAGQGTPHRPRAQPRTRWTAP